MFRYSHDGRSYVTEHTALDLAKGERLVAESKRSETKGERPEAGAEPCMPDEELLYDLADLFKVFSDTTRIKILYSLFDEPRSVGSIAETVGATQSAVSHQLRILKQARLVRFDRDGRSLIYSLADDHVHTMLAQGMNHICE